MKRLFTILNVLKFVLVTAMILMFINFNARIGQQAAETQDIAANTNNVVRSQADILKAIKAVTDDTHTTAAQQTAIIICMLQVPVSNRTTDLQTQCRKQATSVNVGSVSGTASSSPSSGQSSSVQPTPPTSVPQSNSSQSSVKAPNLVESIYGGVQGTVQGLLNLGRGIF